MHRIDTPGAVDGKFQDGNPAVGQQATQLRADWFNDVQEEIATVIEEAGIVLTKGDTDQLYSAIIALVAGVVGDGGGAVPTTRQVLAGGIATGGGDLAADRTITVNKATPGEVSAGVRDDVVVTPLGLVGLVGQTGAGGTMILTLGDAIVQIFTGTAGANGTTVLTLPQAFPTECVAAFCNGGSPDADAQDNFPYVSGKGLTSVSIFSPRDSSLFCNVIAFGR